MAQTTEVKNQAKEQNTTPDEIREQRDKVFLLDWKEAGMRGMGRDFSKEAGTLLATIGTALAKLRKKYAEHPDFKHTEQLYLDVKEDFAAGRTLDLDTSVGPIVKELAALPRKKRMAVSGLKPSTARDLVDKMERAGVFEQGDVKVEYVIIHSPAAPVVTLLLQRHPQMADEYDPRAAPSQSRIKKMCCAMVEARLVDMISPEGMPYGTEVEMEDARKSYTVDRLRVNYPNLDMKGVDEAGIIATVYIEDMCLKLPRDTNLLNLAFRNVFIADNMAATIQKKKYDHVTMTMGRAHEKNMSNVLGQGDHPLPLSELLAREGLNVIVIDTTKGNK